MPVAARSDEHGSKHRPFPVARPPRRGQWTAEARRSPTAFVTAVKVSNDQMRGSQFSSCIISLPYRRYGCAPLLSVALAECIQILYQEIAYTLHRVLRSGHTAGYI